MTDPTDRAPEPPAAPASAPAPTDWMLSWTEDEKPRTRPTAFNPEAAERVCSRIAEGRSIRAACDCDGTPHWRTFMRWLATADPERAEGDLAPGPFEALRQQYARAREIRADARVENADTVLAMLAAGRIKADAARVMLDTIKWQAGKENAKRYGDALTLKGDKENPLDVRRTARDLTEEELTAIALGGIRAAE